MPTDIGKLDKYKERILSHLESKGPSLPIGIAQALGVSTIFASAFLSELRVDRKIQMSAMRVGSSPVYYLPEHESQLATFSDYLNQREREAFFFLRDSKVLRDDALTPVMRVALRALPDFAKPFSIFIDGQSTTFWRYFVVSESDAQALVAPSLSPIVAPVVEPQTLPAPLPEAEAAPPAVAALEEDLSETPSVSVPQPKIEKNSVSGEGDFVDRLRAHFTSHGFLFVRDMVVKKKEYIGVVLKDGLFGVQEFLVVAKDKKTISDIDLDGAYQKAHGEKMMALFASSGSLHKKAQEHLHTWKNLIRFVKI